MRQPPASTPPASHYQRRILAFVSEGRGHGVVTATAGSGKTSTLVLVARQLEAGLQESGGQACFLAFNRATAAELRARLPAAVHATTLHALGRRILLASHPQAQPPVPDARKYRRLARVLLEERALLEGRALPNGRGPLATVTAADFLARLAHFARLELTPPADLEALAAVAARYRLEPPVVGADLRALLANLEPLLQRGAEAGVGGALDFTDMLYLPVTLALSPPRFVFVCVDEAQDLSSLGLALVMRLVAAGARALFVGDPSQAIYAFAGADAGAMSRIEERTGAEQLPLSVSYRCPVRHVALARRYAPAMEPRPRAPLGEVRIISAKRLAAEVEPGDLVMARTNQDLVDIALKLAARGLPTRVLGAELAARAAELAATLFPGEAPDFSDAQRRVRLSADAETAALERELLADLRLPGALQDSSERHAALALALKHVGRSRATLGREALLAALDALFAGVTPGPLEPVVLSSIHRAKGREARNVFLLDADALAVARTRSPEEDKAEANVLFVALTRSRERLVLVESETGAIAKRLAAAGQKTAAERARGPPAAVDEDARDSLPRRWEDVLRFASRMDRAARDPGSLGSGRIIRAWHRTLSTRLRAASSSSSTSRSRTVASPRQR